MSARHTFLVLPLLATFLVPRLEARDLASALPASSEVSALADLATLRQEHPQLLAEGPLARMLAGLNQRGIPAPVEDLEGVAIGLRIGGPDGIQEGVTLVRSQSPIVPLVKDLAAREGVEFTETARRGLIFYRGEWRGRASEFAEMSDGVTYAGYDAAGKFPLGVELQAAAQGKGPSFRDRFGSGLDAGVYLTLKAEFDKAARARLEDGKLAKMAQLQDASLTCKRTADKVELSLDATLVSGFKARLATPLIRRKLASMAEQIADPAARKVLQDAKLSRKGSTLMFRAEASTATFGPALSALLELMEAKQQAKAGAAD